MNSPETKAPPAAAEPRRRATLTGTVISDRMDKTIVVAVERRVSHGRYSRVVKRTSKFYAHDEESVCKQGDLVTIVESRPLSRLKRWRVRAVVRRARHGVAVPGIEADIDEGRPKRRGRTRDAEAEAPAASGPEPGRSPGAGEE